MDIPPLQARRPDLSNVPLDSLAANTQLSEKDKIGEASRAFEAVLLRQILQESQKPVFASKLIGNSATDGIYRDMVVSQLADSISKSGSFGLAKNLAGQLQRQTGTAKSAAPTTVPQPSTAASLRTVSVRSRAPQPQPAGADAHAPLTTPTKSTAPTQPPAGQIPRTTPNHE